MKEQQTPCCCRVTTKPLAHILFAVASEVESQTLRAKKAAARLIMGETMLPGYHTESLP